MKDPNEREYVRALSFRFESKDQFLPLQAADILAYELYKDAPRRLGRESKRQRFPLTELALLKWNWFGLDDENLRVFSKALSIRAAMEDAGRLKPL